MGKKPTYITDDPEVNGRMIGQYKSTVDYLAALLDDMQIDEERTLTITCKMMTDDELKQILKETPTV